MLEELARAKVNLSLRVLGMRPDGYHELDSIVAFAGIGDRLTFVPAGPFELATEGPFAAAIDTDNLIAKAVRLALEAEPALVTGRFKLTKRLPVAAGIGGGSANAAAALRLLRAANPALTDRVDWIGLAARLGADVPICLRQHAARMTGIGERIAAIQPFPRVGILFANPRRPLRTVDVFQSLAAAPFSERERRDDSPLPLRDASDLVAHLRQSPNDLEAPARGLCPQIAPLLAGLGTLPGALIARMSGSGPTCFALFSDTSAAEAAASQLGAAFPGYWIAASELG